MQKRVDIAAAQRIQSLRQLKGEGLTRGTELSLCKPTRGFLQVCCGVIDDHLVVQCTDQSATRRRRQRRRGQRFDMDLLVSKSGQHQTFLREASIRGRPLAGLIDYR
jgi:hypothetical protein